MLERGGVAEWLGLDPVAGCEMRVADEDRLRCGLTWRSSGRPRMRLLSRERRWPRAG